MQQLSSIDFALWVASPLLQSTLAVMIWRRGLRRDFPMFFSYTVFQVLSHVLMYVAFRTSETVYFYAYCTIGAIGIALGFLVIREVFLEAFRPFEAIRELGVVLFRWSALVLLLVAAATTIVAPNSHNIYDGIYTTMITLERSIRVMQCGLVLFMLLFSSYLGLTKKHFVFGISLGFGIFSSVQMLALTARAYPGTISGTLVSQISAAAYVASVAVWIGYAMLPAPARRKVEVLPQSDRWNHALAGVLEVPQTEGFLPSMERTVERLLQQQRDTKQ